MEIIKKSFGFKHLLSYERLVEKESLELPFKELEKIVLFNGIYKTGPFILSVDFAKGEVGSRKYTYYIPLNTSIKLKERKEGFEVVNDFEVKDALCMQFIGKHHNYKDGFEKLKAYAEENNVKIGNCFYCLFLELYDDVVLEVYAPLAKGEESTC